MAIKNNKSRQEDKNISLVKSTEIDQQNENLSRKMIARNIIMAVIVFGALIFFSIKYTPQMLELISSTEKLRLFLLAYGQFGMMVFLGIQATHILIPIIPGEVVQIGGGYVYGTIVGSILLYIGMLIGTIIVFSISRLFGYPLVRIFVSKKKIKEFERISRSKKVEVILFILFLIPGVPKDILLYITGLMPVKAMKTIIMSTIARMPGVIGSAYIGANLLKKNYTIAITVATISIMMFIIGALFRKKLFTMLSNS